MGTFFVRGTKIAGKEISRKEFTDSKSWTAIERSLEAAARASDLRERSRRLREASRLLREESARLVRIKYLGDAFVASLNTDE